MLGHLLLGDYCLRQCLKASTGSGFASLPEGQHVPRGDGQAEPAEPAGESLAGLGPQAADDLTIHYHGVELSPQVLAFGLRLAE